MDIEIIQDGEGKTFEDVNFSQVLLNTNELTVDGEIFRNVTKVTIHN